MKFGIIIPSYINSDTRRQFAERSYKSLMTTQLPSEDCPVDLWAVAAGDSAFNLAVQELDIKDRLVFLTMVFPQPDELAGLDPAIAWCVERLFASTDCTHVIELADDMIYNPRWFIELKALVERHPDARAWSVYRSAHTNHHRTLRETDGDHLVTSLAGNGTCWTREEWAAWGVNWTQGPTWPVPTGGDTLDLHHAYARPGERWATDKSWLDHIGTVGIHAAEGIPEHALNFQGEE
jgi:hypothetical protein